MKQADIRGILLAVTSMFLFSMYLVAVQCFLRDENPLTITFYVISFASVAFCAVAGGPATLLNYGRDGVLIALALGLVPTVLAVTLLYMAIGTIGSSYTSVFSTLEPVTTVIASWIILGDPIAPWQVAGGLLIIIGIVWPNIDLLRQGHGATHPA
nr:DMT family transporter [Desulfobaculum xiamenense]